MGFFSDNSGKRARNAAVAASNQLQSGYNDATGQITSGFDTAKGYLEPAVGSFQSLADLYGGGTNLYLDSLGVNGAAGNQRAQQSFQAGPGYQYAVDQSLDGVNRHAAATGMLASGNTLAALSDRAGQMANQEYGNWQSRLGGLGQMQLAALTGANAGRTTLGTLGYNRGRDLAGMRTGLAQDNAGLITGAAKASSQAEANNRSMAMDAINMGTKLIGSFL